MSFVADMLGVVERIIRVFRWHRNPFRQQAARVLSAFSAHEITPTQIARILPDEVLNKPASVLADPESLKDHMSEPFLSWVQDTLQLERGWIDGTERRPHQRVFSYKSPSLLHEFIAARTASPEYASRFVIHVFKGDDAPLSAQSSGAYVVILEEAFAELDNRELRRFYYLTEGGWLDHYPGLLHLMQIMAIASFYGIHVWGRVLKRNLLRALEAGEDFVPNLWHETLGKSWYPEDPLWKGLSGNQDWNARVRKDLDVSLQSQRMQWLVDSLEAKR